MKILGVRPLSFFELGKVGLPITILGILYFIIAGKAFLTPGDSSDKDYLDSFMGKSSNDEASSMKGLLNLVILGAVLAAMAFDNDAFPMHLVAALGAMVMILTGCIKENDAYKAVDWSTIFIVAGMSAVSKAMDASVAARLLSTSVANLIGTESSKLLDLFVIIGFTMLLTNFMMNTTTAILLTPLFIPLAIGLQINPVAVGVGICIAASSTFLTPSRLRDKHTCCKVRKPQIHGFLQAWSWSFSTDNGLLHGINSTVLAIMSLAEFTKSKLRRRFFDIRISNSTAIPFS